MWRAQDQAVVVCRSPRRPRTAQALALSRGLPGSMLQRCFFPGRGCPSPQCARPALPAGLMFQTATEYAYWDQVPRPVGSVSTAWPRQRSRPGVAQRFRDVRPPLIPAVFGPMTPPHLEPQKRRSRNATVVVWAGRSLEPTALAGLGLRRSARSCRSALEATAAERAAGSPMGKCRHAGRYWVLPERVIFEIADRCGTCQCRPA